TAFGNLRHVLPANIQPREDRQPDGSPTVMTKNNRQRNPHMSIAEGVAAGTGCRVVMNACPLDLRSVTFGGRIVDRQQHPWLILEDRQEQDQQPASKFRPPPANALQKEVEVLKVMADSGRSDPRCDHPPPAGEERSQQHYGEPPRRAT